MKPRRLIAAHEIAELRDEDRPDLMERQGLSRPYLEPPAATAGMAAARDLPSPREPWAVRAVDAAEGTHGPALLFALWAGLFLLGRWLWSWL